LTLVTDRTTVHYISYNDTRYSFEFSEELGLFATFRHNESHS